MVPCVICQGLFPANYPQTSDDLPNCAGIIASEEKLLVMKQEKLYVYRCKECRESGNVSERLEEFMGQLMKTLDFADEFNKYKDCTKQLIKTVNNVTTKQIPELTTQIKDVQQDLTEKVGVVNDNIDEQINTVKDIIDSKILNAKVEMIREYNSKEHRKYNVIMYNIPDDNDTEADMAIVIQLINDTSRFTADNLFVKRLGESSEQKCRPVLVRTKSLSDTGYIFLKKAEISKRSLAIIPNLPTKDGTNEKVPVVCAPDRTKTEIQLFNKVKDELNAKPKSERLKYRIKFIDGVPELAKVINIESKKKSKNGQSQVRKPDS